MTSIDSTNYVDGEGGPAALAADLATELELANADPILEGEGWKLMRDGRGGFITVEEPFRERPRRAVGSAALTDPAAFGDYVNRLRTVDTTLWANLSTFAVTAVFNDHPAVRQPGDTEAPLDTFRPLAGYRDHSATLSLEAHPDWITWKSRDMAAGSARGTSGLMGQRDFGEFVEDMAHTIIRPDSATMLEVATTLTAKRSLDFDSRTRLDNGDVGFRFQEETTARAGRGQTEIEIPQRFTIRVPIFLGTEPIEVEARLRFRPDQDGVRMGYRLLRWKDHERDAFDAVVATVTEATDTNGATFYGSAPLHR